MVTGHSDVPFFPLACTQLFAISLLLFSLMQSTHTNFSLLDIQVLPLTLTVVQAHKNIQLQQKPMEVLCYLASQYPALVTREQLISAVWDGNVYVGEKALTNTIWQLRQLLNQCNQPELIATVRKKGYRLQIAPLYQPTLLAALDTQVAATNQRLAPTAAANQLQDELPQPSTPLTRAKPAPAHRFRQFYAAWAGWAVAILFAVCFWFWQSATPTPTMRQVSQQQGWSMYPTVTPDGRTLVYTWQQFGQPADLYLLDLRQPEASPRQLTFSDAHELRPVISHDGQQVFYSSKTADGSCQIQQLSLLTLQEQSLQRCSRHSDVYLDLSADDRFLYFNGSRDTQGRSWYRLDLSDTNASPQPMPCRDFCEQRVRDIAVHPSNSSIALTRRANRLSEEVFLYDTKNGKERQLTTGQADIRGLAWSADGKSLLFSTDHNGRSQGYMLDVASGQQTALPLEDVSFVSRVSQDQQVFFHRDSSIPQLGYLQLHTTSAIFPITAGTLSYQSPDFHQGRNQLLYISNESGQSELWLSDRQLLKKQQLTRLNGVIKYPRWSHGGDQILFVSRAATSSKDQLTLLDVATGKLTFPATGVTVHGRPAWTADDQAIIFPVDGKLVRFDLQSADKAVLSQGSGLYAQMPDKTGFYYTKGRGQGIWWQPMQQHQPIGEPQQVISGDDFSDSYNWLVTEQHIFYLQARKDGVTVRAMDRRSQQHQSLVLIPSGQTDLSASLAFDAAANRLILQYTPVPQIDIWQWQLPK